MKVFILDMFSLCSLLCVLNSYIFPLVLNMHFAFLTHGKWARYVPCKCSHMHWLLSIFQQGLTNVIVSFFCPFFPGPSHPLCLNPKASLDFLAAQCQLSCLFPSPPPVSLERHDGGWNMNSKRAEEPLSWGFFFPSLISKLHRHLLITLMALDEDWHFFSS